MLYKRCKHPDPTKCRCPYWYMFKLYTRRYARSTRTANRQIAERTELRRRNAILDGKDDTPIAETRLSDLIRDYKAAVKEEHATANKTERVLDQFLAFVKDQPISKISPFTIEKWKLARAKDVEQSTVNRELTVLRGLFSRAVKWRKLAVSPMADVAVFKTDDVRIRVFTDEEIAHILHDAPPFTALLIRTTLECLPRLSEVLNLKREHVHAGWIEVRRKGGRVDRLPITSSLHDALLAHGGTREWIFGEGRRGMPPSQQTATNRVLAALRSLGIKDASHHTARHTGITLMLEDGVNPRAIQRLAGWTSLRMIERYGHVRDAELQRAVTGMSQRLPTQRSTEGNSGEVKAAV